MPEKKPLNVKVDEPTDEDFEAALEKEESEETTEHAEPPAPDNSHGGKFLTDAEVEKLRLAAEEAAIRKAEAATAKQEKEAEELSLRQQAALLKANQEQFEKEQQAAEHEAKAREILAKRLLDGKARPMDKRHRHENLTRPVNMEEVEIRDLQIYPAHIAAHAILANIHGESYDPFHDNEFSRNPDGSVRCSVKILPEHGGGHDRFDVHPPDLVKMVLVEKKLVEAA